MADEQRYWQTLTELCREHADAVARVYRLRPGYLREDMLAIVVNFTAGAALREHFAGAGNVDTSTLLETLAALPEETQHPRTAVEALAWFDRGACQGRRIPDVLMQTPLLQPSVERAFKNRRRQKTEHSLRRIIENRRLLHRHLHALRHAARSGRLRRTHAAAHREMMRQLRSSEWHARASGGWAVKNRFPVVGVSRALHRLYIGPLRRISGELQFLEQLLTADDRDRLAPRTGAAARRMLHELMEAAATDVDRSRRGDAVFQPPSLGKRLMPRPRPRHRPRH